MRERFLPSGRVHYFPMHDYLGEGRFKSLLSGKECTVEIAKKTVDGTLYNTSVPSTHKRKFDVADNVACIAPNGLPKHAAGHTHYVLLGAGKTAMDAGVWLIDNGADPNAITWVCPRDSWLMNRATTQPGPEFFESTIGGQAAQFEALAAATNTEDLFLRLEAAGYFLRIDQDVMPSMFHFATISTGEVAQLQKINTVVRGHRTARIDDGRMTMQNGDEIDVPKGVLYIDCTATAVEFSKDNQPVFDGDMITLQPLRAPLVTLSAAIAAYVEAHYESDEEKNNLCTPVLLCDTPEAWLHTVMGNMQNQYKWSQEKPLRNWIAECRLDGFSKMVAQTDMSDPKKADIVKRLKEGGMPAAMNVQKLLSEITG